MASESTRNWLRSLSVSVCASVFCSCAARADFTDVPNVSSMGLDFQPLAQRRHQANFRTPRNVELNVSRGTQRNRDVLRIQRDTAALSRSINTNRQFTHLMNRMSHIGIGRPGQISAFRTTDTSLTQTSLEPSAKTETVSAQTALATDAPRRSTYINYEGDEKHLSRGFTLDLSSTDANVTVGSNLLDGRTVTINVGDTTKQVSAGSLLTAAEFAALNQKLNDGNQSLTLSNTGAATGGALNLNLVSDDGRTIRASDLVVPLNVSVVGDFARAADGIRVRNDVVNSGSIYAISSNPERRSAVVSASNVTNTASGLISTEVSSDLSSKDKNVLNLVIRADKNIDNDGTIISSGDLELTAGSSLQSRGTATAKGLLTVNSANVRNSGLIQSVDSNVIISAPQDSHLLVDNTGGEISANNGNIELSTASLLNPKLNTNLVGGDWHSKQLNVDSTDGSVDAILGDVTGLVSIKAGAAHINADTQDLLLGDMQLTGDPTFSNSGNLVLTGLALVTGGAPLALVAGGNITAGTATSIDTSNAAGAGGSITIVAGAKFNIAGNLLTITGSTATGGNIDLTGVTKISSSGTTDGGDIRIVTLNDVYSTTTGKITIPASTNITSGGGGTGKNGFVDILAERSDPGISIGGVDTRGGSGGGGSIRVIVRDLAILGGGVVIDNTTGAVVSGSFFPSIFNSNTPISTGDLYTNGMPISVETGLGNVLANKAIVSTGVLDTGAIGGTFAQVSVVGETSVKVNGLIRTHNLLLFTQGVLDLNNVPSITIPTDNGNGGFITISADTLISSKEVALSAIGTSGKGGYISVDIGFGVGPGPSGPTTIGGAGSDIKLDAHGVTDGGTAIFITDVPVVVNAGGINAAGTNGSGATIEVQGSTLELNDTSFITQADATGNNGNGGGLKLRGTFGIDVANSLSSPLVLSANGIGTGNGGEVSFGIASNDVPLFVGTPSKAPKTAANYITASAKSGLLGGDGGSISVENGTTITVDMKAADASAQSSVGKWNGASYSFDANPNGFSNASNLVITGSINANGINGGNAGIVSLQSNSAKTAFTLNAGKTPKNGISGSISANGNLGSISVLNEHGGIKVNSQQALTSPTISLVASGDAQTTKAKITVKNAVLTAGQSLSLTGYNGIGTLSVSAPTLAINSQVGKVKVTSVPTTAVTLLDSFGGAGFTFTSGGPTTLNDIGTNAGAIKVTGGKGGLLQVAANSTIEAKNSSVALLNLDTASGSILIGNNSKIQTSGAKAKDAIIAIGKSKKANPFTGTNPPNMNVTETKGTVYFGPNPTGVVATGPTAATITANNKSVIFSNGSTNSGTNKITLGSNVSVIGGQ